MFLMDMSQMAMNKFHTEPRYLKHPISNSISLFDKNAFRYGFMLMTEQCKTLVKLNDGINLEAILPFIVSSNNL